MQIKYNALVKIILIQFFFQISIMEKLWPIKLLFEKNSKYFTTTERNFMLLEMYL